MRHLIALTLPLFLISYVAGCGSADDASGASDQGPYGGGGGPNESESPTSSGSGNDEEAKINAISTLDGNRNTPAEDNNYPLLLLGADWDDNSVVNFENWYVGYHNDFPLEFNMPSDAVIPVADRALIHITNDLDENVPGAVVTVMHNGQQVTQVTTGRDGRALILPERDGLTIEPGDTITIATPDNQPVQQETVPADPRWFFQVPGAQPQAATDAYIAIAFEATGSMVDEHDFLLQSLELIDGNVAMQYPNVTRHYAIVAYRDLGEPVTFSDFSIGTAGAMAELGQTVAENGGDYPEEVQEGLATLNDLSWGGTATDVRMAFVFGDAPAREDVLGEVANQILASRAQGIRLYPIAASGTGDVARFSFRQAAQVTLGRFLFLPEQTEDIDLLPEEGEAAGNIPCFYVDNLAHLMERAIESEIRGSWIRLSQDLAIDEVGDPNDDTGLCLFKNASEASL